MSSVCVSVCLCVRMSVSLCVYTHAPTKTLNADVLLRVYVWLSTRFAGNYEVVELVGKKLTRPGRPGLDFQHETAPDDSPGGRLATMVSVLVEQLGRGRLASSSDKLIAKVSHAVWLAKSMSYSL